MTVSQAQRGEASLASDRRPANDIPPVVAEPRGPAAARLQFSIGTMLLVTTLVAICLAITMAIPVLGFAFSVIAVGGLVRTMIVGWARVRAGQRFELSDKLEAFFVSSSAFVISLVLALSVTLVLSCCALFLASMLAEIAEPLFAIIFFAGIPAACVAGIFVFAKLYLSFGPAVTEQIASAEPPWLNQMSGTKYRHRPG
jgi:hypothetical protein